MPDPASALAGASFDGFAAIREIGPTGMITLRAGADTAGVADAVRHVMGLDLPETRRIVTQGARSVAWMSPDEWLLVLPYSDVPAAIGDLTQALADRHALVADVSDARAAFSVVGPATDQVIAKLCPVDLALFPVGELRRTRLAQVACALWRPGPEAMTVVTFRSVARYAFDLLSNAAH